MILEKLNPAVDRKYLILLAGIVWCGVGIMLITFATTWLIRYAGEGETAMMYFIRPDLVDQQAIKSQSGLDQAKLKGLQNGYTGIWWYARFPNHFASDVAEPDKRLGELLIASEANQLADLIKYLKTNNTIESLQEEFYKKADNPLQK